MKSSAARKPKDEEPRTFGGRDIELLVAKDLKAAAQKLSVGEARYLVDLYYQDPGV